MLTEEKLEIPGKYDVKIWLLHLETSRSTYMEQK